MSKKSYIIIFLIIIIILIISLFVIKNNNQESKTIENININNHFSFYKDEYQERYLNYKKKYNLNDKDTILRVNIGLDKPFYTNASLTKRNDLYILVNKYNYLEKDYIPKDMIITNKHASKEIKINEEAYYSFLKMVNDLEKENLHLRIVSAYRSYDYQNNLYQNYLEKDKQENVDTYSARPGFSEHQTGLAIDVDNIYINYDKFHLTQEFTWMKNNAYKYGFILRYPLDKQNITGYKYEPWHYRYVGIETSRYIYQNNLTFEEYYYEFLD